MIFAADVHSNPDKFPDEAKEFIAIAHEMDTTPVFVGDTFNILPYGIDAYRNCPAILSFLRCLLLRDVILIPGNHDPDEKLRELFMGCKNVKVTPTDGMDTGGLCGYIYVTHGHMWGPLWSWLGPIATPFNRFANRFFSKQWYAFAKARGWMPSQVKGESRYHIVVRRLLDKAVKHSLKHECVVVMGHTHFEYQLKGNKVKVYNLPPLVKRRYLSVTDKIEIKDLL